MEAQHVFCRQHSVPCSTCQLHECSLPLPVAAFKLQASDTGGQECVYVCVWYTCCWLHFFIGCIVPFSIFLSFLEGCIFCCKDCYLLWSFSRTPSGCIRFWAVVFCCLQKHEAFLSCLTESWGPSTLEQRVKAFFPWYPTSSFAPSHSAPS